ncbi:FAD-dependent monooxygenase [Georgenia halophila]|uniref:FAD-dependent monooxygenase n=1 Tax=Georgenia halophila TaxID=620889 RepID=A0ABP8KUP9_9MICO
MNVVICGAGIAGLTLAHRMSNQGWGVTVLEKASGPRTQGYMIDFFGPGYDAAEAMGLLPRLHELGYRVDEARFVDARGRPRARLKFRQFAQSQDGRLLSIMRPDLELVLRESLPEAVDLRFGTSPTTVETDPDGVRVTLSDGQRIGADLLVGADGIHSTVRSSVFARDRDVVRYLGFHTAAFTFSDPAVRARVGDRFHLTDSVDRQMGLYGLRDGRVATYLVHRAADPTLPDDRRATLRATYGSLGWVVPDALSRCPRDEEIYYDQIAQVEMPHWHYERVVLVGDACYAVSLIAGQGASLGVAGAFVLAEQLGHGPSVEEGLARYEELWRPVVEEKQQVARQSVRWFLPRSRVQVWLRRVMLALARLPGFDRLVVGAIGGKHTTIVRELAHQSGRLRDTSTRR